MGPEVRMKLRYGVNQADECWDFALGPARERIWSNLRDIDTRLVRIFLFDKQAPDPLTEWPVFAAYVQAVLDIGAVPMITFAKFHRPFGDPRAVRWFAGQCADVVWSCIEQWGASVVRDWYWCIWNEPNSDWIGGGLSFEQYRRIYEEVAQAILGWLGPHLERRQPLIGGPAIEGFRPFWMDWAWRFLNEIDNSLIGFLDWHRYGDWREYGEMGAPHDEATYKAMMMSVAPDYEVRARAIAQVIEGRPVENICGELNAHSHYWADVRGRFNYSVFGAAFYATSLLQLMRGGADAELYWTGTEDTGGYGMMDKHGEPRPAFHAKKLCAQHIRYGDWISFPGAGTSSGIDVVAAPGDDGRRSALIVHLRHERASYSLADLRCHLGSDSCVVRKIDEGTGNRIAEHCDDGAVAFDGYGVAAITGRDG